MMSASEHIASVTSGWGGKSPIYEITRRLFHSLGKIPPVDIVLALRGDLGEFFAELSDLVRFMDKSGLSSDNVMTAIENGERLRVERPFLESRLKNLEAHGHIAQGTISRLEGYMGQVHDALCTHVKSAGSVAMAREAGDKLTRLKAIITLAADDRRSIAIELVAAGFTPYEALSDPVGCIRKLRGGDRLEIPDDATGQEAYYKRVLAEIPEKIETDLLYYLTSK